MIAELRERALWQEVSEMADISRQLKAGQKLRQLIQENFRTQEEFAERYGMEIRSVSRYINQGINKVDVIQELADFFQVNFLDFFT